MIYFTLLNSKESTQHIIDEIQKKCGNHVKTYVREFTTHIELGSRYTAMILTNSYDGAVLHINARNVEDKTRILIKLTNINSILEMN
ncbi:MAG: hypothetical protein J6S85_21430 [Methanobrevibacter sp.]|nr:hypothetical protein [Methanobrevibacter sp.]